MAAGAGPRKIASSVMPEKERSIMETSFALFSREP
jgi:hypothetical protein